MIPFIFNFFIIVVVFSILIIVHELGHFFAARLFGVKVTDFSIGFGPALFKKKIRQTNLSVCLFPLGGYIKMAGDNRSESRGYRDEFFSKSPGIRSGIVFAGPLFNYILAFLFLIIIATVGFPVQDTIVGAVENGSPAQEAGIQPGDKLVAVNDKKVETWSQLKKEIYQAEASVDISLERNNEKIQLNVPVVEEEMTDQLGRTTKVSQIGIMLYKPVIGEVIEQYPAEEAGIKKGDQILEVDGEKIENWQDLAENIQGSKEAVELKIKRGKEVFSLKVPVKKEEVEGFKSGQEYISVIGIRPPSNEKILKTAFPGSLLKGADMLFKTTLLSVKGLWYMITDPSISFRESIAGPIYISYIISKTAQHGLVALLQLISLLSIFLFIINLLPIPVFDGGHIVFFGIEKLKGSPLSQKTEDAATRVGLALIMVLMFFVFYNDIVKRGPKIWKEIKSSFNQESNEKN
ncbi:MAG: RIP metalloprotease RseP [Candidatus Omnitrophica bacterium]|nr:RIP metalloprotease RseP [Candidatus Omnitrophota bacterium]MCF7891992.1 RIP metalloprotease RseP [Candidatus Omnitrophota bacterium]MCF7895933.1 RIP metalloprotease RseP [Candidatus Omnitrophota bacterium]MCF7897483.1 RIP metalloprotease RseP [Candidatus Omnitrophota bacterium]MCF7909264.1 RIP metalloprotease RseP [Candidatus Omnitrophota bacterium]